jgi:predicted amino acid racemase
MSLEIEHYREYRRLMAEAEKHDGEAADVQAKIDRLREKHNEITGRSFYAREHARRHGRALAALTDRDVKSDRDIDEAVESYKREYPHIVEAA